jgi:hypothetical protein
MGDHLNWDKNKRDLEYKNSKIFLKSMGLDYENCFDFNNFQIKKFKDSFYSLDTNFGYVNYEMLKNHLEIDLNFYNLDQFLENNNFLKSKNFTFQDYINLRFYILNKL